MKKRKLIYKGSRKQRALMLNQLHNSPRINFKENETVTHGDE